MASKLFVAVVLVFNLMAFAAAVVAAERRRTKLLCHNDESLALLQFKENLFNDCRRFGYSSNYSKVSFWVSKSNDCCRWRGVKCNENTSHVASLDLSSSCLFGTINSSSSLFQLVHLHRLNLADNDFNYSQIPSGFRHLSRLTSLNLSYAGFYGQIPSEILELSELISLDLSENKLELLKPSLRSITQNLTNLKELNLNGVNMSSMVPKTMTNLPSLTFLSLSDCNLYGEFSIKIFHLPNLQSIDLSFNLDLNGSIPKFNQSNTLESLDLSLTSFFGKLPKSIANLTFLQHFGIFGCNFFGPIPFSFGKLTQLVSLQVSENRFCGEFPNSIFHLPNLRNLEVEFNKNLTLGLLEFNRSSPLEFLDISNTPFSSKLLHSIGNLKSLSFFSARRCNFSRPIPSSLGNVTQIIELYLLENSLYGSIPEFIYKLTNLEYLDLNSNYLNGIVEFDLFLKLKKLRSINLSFNNISLLTKPSTNETFPKFWTLILSDCHLREFPDFLRNQDQLEILDLSGNEIQGQVPKWMCNATKDTLWSLDLSFNFLVGFNEIPIFSPQSNLEILNLDYNKLQGPPPIPPLSVQRYSAKNNKLTGEISNWICNLSSIITLDLSRNNLNGSLPQCLGNLSKQDQLEILDLSHNKIYGQIPRWIWDATNTLQSLDLSYNLLTGVGGFPVFPPWSNLYVIRLDSNKFQGPLPIPPPFIEIYSVANNKLTGEISSWICNLSSIIALDLSNNNLMGSLPQCLGNLSISLSVLNLHRNNFHGSIPSFWKSSNLGMIDLSQNHLEGPLPRSLANCTWLEVLNLGDNQIIDSFPFWLGGLSILKVLILRFNKFNGTIGNPIIGFDFLSLHVMDLSHNDITGMLPSQLFQKWKAMQTIKEKSLKYINNGYYNFSMTFINKGNEMVYEKILDLFIAIDLSNNRFEGQIPKVIGHLKGLKLLNLSKNFLIGHIPSSLGNLTELESLDLSHNKLCGMIPFQLVKLNFLSFIDVSYNHLRGPIPFGNQFDTFANSSYSNNLELCGSPLSKKCENLEHPYFPSSTFEDNQNWRFLFEFSWKVVAMGYGCGFVGGLVLGITKKHDCFTRSLVMGE